MLTLEHIKDAESILNGKVFKTPLVYSSTLSRMFNSRIYLKLENLQKTGSFKIRGAVYKLHKSASQIGPDGVIAASAGNHAQGVALAAEKAGVSSTIIMPEWASISKQEATRAYGAELIISGKTLGESIKKARHSAEKENKLFIHPYDDWDIMAGQGVVGLEIVAEKPETDLIIGPIGGGGLMAGIATATKAFNKNIQVVGVQAESCPSAYKAFKTGRIQSVPSASSLADGITIKEIGEKTFELIRRHMDNVVLVKEEQIARAVLLLLERKKILAEGAGAVSLAALISGKIKFPPQSTIVLIISGGNVDSPQLDRIIKQGLLFNHRILRIRVLLDDTPGSLAALLNLTARLNANVLNIYHERNHKDLPIHITRVGIELETRNEKHIQEIENTLKKHGYTYRISPGKPHQ